LNIQAGSNSKDVIMEQLTHLVIDHLQNQGL